ncbi:MAG TPA: hypothetical protein VF181_05085 [Balneolaceae bacterium]
MSLQSSFEELHKKVISNPWLKLFTAIVRGWLAVGFIIPGLRKISNNHFAPNLNTPNIKAFFDAFFQAAEFYIFVGIVQVMAGIFLLFPTTAALGAVLYLPVILNIFFITVALGFKGTWIITSLMLLTNIYLLCWEFDKWQALVPGFIPSNSKVRNRHLSFLPTIIASGLSGFLAVGLLFTALGIIEENNIRYPILIAISSLVVSGYLLFKYRIKYVHD